MMTELTNFIASIKGMSNADRVRWTIPDTHLAFAIVAIEIPVEPTVPSNIREPV